MEKATLGDVVAITRLLEHFNTTSLNKFKGNLMDRIGCLDENLMLCKMFLWCYHKIDSESMMELKNETIKIAQSQRNNQNISLYKQIQSYNTDKISKMPNDIICYLGTFLNHTESMAFSHLNTQMYIAMQNKSYFLQRKDDAFIINEEKINQLLLSPQSNILPYNFPSFLYFDDTDMFPSKLLNEFVKTNLFENFFYCTKMISIPNIFYLVNIPINILFSKSLYNDGDIRQMNIVLCSNETNDYYKSCFDSFITKIINFYNNNNNVRMIDNLCIRSDGEFPDEIKKIIASFSDHFIELQLSETTLNIDNDVLLNKVFHKRLSTLSLVDGGRIKFKRNQLISIKTKNIVCELEDLYVSINESWSVTRMLQDMHNYVGCINSMRALTLAYDGDAAITMLTGNQNRNLFDCIKLIWSDNKFNDLVELTIVISDDSPKLFMTSMLFRKINELKDIKTNIKQINIDITHNKDADMIHDNNIDTTHEIFQHKMTQEYNSNKMVYNNFDFSLGLMGQIYQNLIHLCNKCKRQDKDFSFCLNFKF